MEAEWPRLGLPRNAQILAARSQDLDVLGSKEKHTKSFCCEWVALTKQSLQNYIGFYFTPILYSLYSHMQLVGN